MTFRTLAPRAAIALALLVTACASQQHGAAPIATDPLQRLMDGNQRFVSGQLQSRDGDAARRAEVAKKQHPFAIVVSCSDSRVGPEVVFDQNIGDIFVIRNAGEVVDDVAMGSIEYAVDHVHVGLIVVLGHSRCGAVEAALAGGTLPGHIGAVVAAIEPAVKESKDEPGNPLDNAIRANVRHVIKHLKTDSAIVHEAEYEHRLAIVGAMYDLDSGMVTLLDQKER